MAPIVYGDFETRSTVDLKKSGVDVYAKSEHTEIVCFGYAIDDGPVQIWVPGSDLPTEIKEILMEGGVFVAHNAPFELAIWNNVGVKKGWLRLNPAQTICTMAMSYAMSLPGSLEKAAAAAGIRHQKDTAGGRVMLQISQPRKVDEDGKITWWDDAEKLQRVFDYCMKDVEVERELYKRLVKLSDPERKMWLLDQKINERGVYVDLPAAKKALELVEFEKTRLDHEIRRVTNNGVATCNAVGQFIDWLKSRGVETKGIAKSDVVELLEKDLPEDVREALLLRQEAAKASTAKLTAILNSVANDGRMRGLFQYHGAGTGRWAGRRVQLQNLPRPKIEQKEIERIFKFLGGTA